MSLVKLLTTTGISMLLSLYSAVAFSQVNFEFEQGAVALYCLEGENSKLPDNVFDEAFPNWVLALQQHANAGDVRRVHYLPEFRSGVFILVGGSSLEDAKKNVEKVEKSIQTILDEALKNAGVTDFNHAPCQRIEIGPVAILPK